jgi:hypothetical protein
MTSMTNTARASSLTALALAGTAHSPNAPLTSGAPVDDLPLPGEDVGRDLLLRAGAAAIYRAAGRLPAHDVAPLEPAPAESRAVCPPAASALIEGFIVTGRDDLLLEAFERMSTRGELLEPSLLPLALKMAQAFTTREMRAALAPVVGERGRWLARHNPDWSWILERTLPGERDALPPDAETIWQEGTSGQRVALLGRLRAHDPARAREWLAGVWKQEKAETRASMLETFATDLSMDDEPFLESALDDRSEKVRAAASDLLTTLPASALARRIRDRADAALTWDGATLEANPPTDVDANWVRDGLPTQRISHKQGQRAIWLNSLLERVDPSHWTERFGRSPAELIPATAASKWRASLLASWSAAATDFQRQDWVIALWDTLLTLPDAEFTRLDADRASYLRPLAPLLPLATREALALRLLADPSAQEDITLYEALGFLRRPWSASIARAYLERLRAFATTMDPRAGAASLWEQTLEDAALAMPEAAFAEALAPIALPEGKSAYLARFRYQLDAFAETIRLRERLVKVLPL